MGNEYRINIIHNFLGIHLFAKCIPKLRYFATGYGGLFCIIEG